MGEGTLLRSLEDFKNRKRNEFFRKGVEIVFIGGLVCLMFGDCDREKVEDKVGYGVEVEKGYGVEEGVGYETTSLSRTDKSSPLR
jgi:hypothetical protein